MLLNSFFMPAESAPFNARWARFACAAKASRVKNRQVDQARDDDLIMTDATQETATEKPILQRMAEGDRGAVKECFDRYGKLVWSVVYRFCPQPGDREDAVQEIFLEIWRSARRYQSNIASEGTFITMIARRRMIDRLRKFQRQPALTDIDEVVDLGLDHRPEGEDNAELVNVSRALSILTPDQQKVIRLSVVQGYSHGEIAAKTGIPIGTVKTHIRRGLMRVRDQLSAAGASASRGEA